MMPTTLHADAVVFATPAYVTARLVESFHPRLAKALRAIPYVSSATISLAYRRRDVPHPLDGFGFLVGKHEGRRIMAATWTSTKFAYRAPADGVLIRSFVGGAGREDLVMRDDAALIQLVRDELNAILGISTAPLLARVYRWERANPQYGVGHLERVDAMEQLLASYPGSISHRQCLSRRWCPRLHSSGDSNRSSACWQHSRPPCESNAIHRQAQEVRPCTWGHWGCFALPMRSRQHS